MPSPGQLSAHVTNRVSIERTPRLLQAAGLFDMEVPAESAQSWDVSLDLPESWHIGCIVGPSGAGKSSVARALFGERLVTGYDWSPTQSVLDGFPASLGIKDITDLLSSVGFSSPPSWLRPFGALSNGEQFRVTLARTLAESPDLAVVDEYTSVVDRTVAQIGSAALAKTVRRRGRRFVAVTCHYDVLDWLQPDWIYEPHTNQLTLARGRLWRPPIHLTIRRVDRSAWSLFGKHHYLSHTLHKGSTCFAAFYQDQPVAFTAVLHFPHPSSALIKREHRTVCLPDFQGVGIGNALGNYVAGLYRAMGFRYQSTTSHPAMMRARLRSGQWQMIVPPNITQKTMPNNMTKNSGRGQIATRLRATFEYCGSSGDPVIARALIKGE